MNLFDKIKQKARKYHSLIGLIFMLPILITATTGVLMVLADDVFHKPELAEKILAYHTMDAFGLGEVYPLIVGCSLIFLILSAIVMSIKLSKKNNN